MGTNSLWYWVFSLLWQVLLLFYKSKQMFFYPDSRFCKGLNFEYAKFSRFQFLEREVTCFDKGDNSILEYLFYLPLDYKFA